MQCNLSQTQILQTLVDALANNSHNPNLCKAIVYAHNYVNYVQLCAQRESQTNTSTPSPPPETVLRGLHKSLKDQIHKIDVDYNTQCNFRAKHRRQRRIAKHPAAVKKEISSGKPTPSTSPPRAQKPLKILTQARLKLSPTKWPPVNGLPDLDTEPNYLPFLTSSTTFTPKIKDWRDITYTDGSVIKKEDALPPLVDPGVYTPSKEDPPSEQQMYYIKSNGPTNAITRAELAGILVALIKGYKVVATDSASCLYQLYKQVVNPMRMKTHLHAELIQKLQAS